jgi:alkanesulfonate monooxygenase SsuD/methylene tetrahydromethanopterin reductase-like flavin-dependent oxidoreductase (luciferase family)
MAFLVVNIMFAAQRSACERAFYRGFVGRNLSFGDLIEAGLFVVGSPATVTRMLTEQLRATGAGHLLAWMNFGSLQPDMVRHSEELFARQVLPHLRELA